jgi:hypothetical protein
VDGQVLDGFFGGQLMPSRFDRVFKQVRRHDAFVMEAVKTL